MTPEFRQLVEIYKATDIEFPNLKPVTVAVWVLESGRGESGLAVNHRNFAGMKYRSEISAYAKRVNYEAHDGNGYYCQFATLADFIAGYWAFLDRSPYEGWRELAHDEIEFIRHVGPIWAEDPNYVEKVLGLLPEARALLDAAEVEVDDGLGADTSRLLLGRPSLTISPDGKVASGNDGLDVIYRGSDDCPYGRTATRNRRAFAGIVLHHTSPRHTTEWYMQYQIDGDPVRGGHFGYHFYISPAGLIYQGAPLTMRTNHVSPSSSVRRSFGSLAQNTNSIGITCARAGTSSGFRPTDEQVREVKALTFALCDVYNIPFSNVFGHGEIQTNRVRSEGLFLAEEIRNWAN
ncbi:MAG: N-acetylmuramoyl-L-alanine amidase [Pseudomonadota bacterium]